MAESHSPGPAAPRKPYARPTLETVPIVADEALLAICALSPSAPGGGAVFQGAPCNSCFSAS